MAMQQVAVAYAPAARVIGFAWLEKPRSFSLRVRVTESGLRWRPLSSTLPKTSKISCTGQDTVEKFSADTPQRRSPRKAESQASDEGGDVGRDFRLCWELFHRGGLPIAEIAKQRRMKEIAVFYCIFACIQNNYGIDWHELCKEAQFTSQIAKELREGTDKWSASSAEGELLVWPVLQGYCSSQVNEIHFGLYFTMLRSGILNENIEALLTSKARFNPVSGKGIVPKFEEARYPRRATQLGLLNWISYKNGATLLQIAVKYVKCDEAELMRTLLSLEDSGQIFRKNGVYRVRKEGEVV